jgi:DMSO/TMAO reductase YedYZ heme-binding membrane subunit
MAAAVVAEAERPQRRPAALDGRMIVWDVLRAAGIGAYLMFFASVAWGLAGTASLFGKRFAKPSMVLIHQFFATTGAVLLALHLTGVLLDTYVPSTPLDILIPLHSSYRPWAIAAGVLAMYAAVIVLVSSWTRKQLSNRLWRALHLLAVPLFTLSMIHGIFTGTDTSRPWMWGMYLATGGIVVFLVLVRLLTSSSSAEKNYVPKHSRTGRRQPGRVEPVRELSRT